MSETYRGTVSKLEALKLELERAESCPTCGSEPEGYKDCFCGGSQKLAMYHLGMRKCIAYWREKYDGLVKSSNETFVDERGTTWTRPTADAYAKVCAALEARTNTLHAIAITLGLETWEDLPAGDTDAVLKAVEGALCSRKLKDYTRGLEAARVSLGATAVDLPVGLGELFEEWFADKSVIYQSGDIFRHAYAKGAESFRDFLKAKKIQTGEPRKEAIFGKLQCSLCRKGLATVSLYIQAKDSIHALCKSCWDGAPSTAHERERCAKIAESVSAAWGQEHCGAQIATTIREGKEAPKDTDGMSEPLTRAKIHAAVQDGYLRNSASIIAGITDSICELLSVGGARVVQPGAERLEAYTKKSGLPRCQSLHGGTQCEKVAGHDKVIGHQLHQGGKEVWSHA